MYGGRMWTVSMGGSWLFRSVAVLVRAMCTGRWWHGSWIKTLFLQAPVTTQWTTCCGPAPTTTSISGATLGTRPSITSARGSESAISSQSPKVRCTQSCRKGSPPGHSREECSMSKWDVAQATAWVNSLPFLNLETWNPCCLIGL